MHQPPESTESLEPPRSANLGDRLRNFPQYLYPQRLLSGWVNRLTRIRKPWFKNWLIRAFIKHFRVDMSEAANPDPTDYPDFNSFFTRSLRTGARPIAAGENIVCCPIDGGVSQAGYIDKDSIFQAKDRDFSLSELLGGAPEHARLFCDGSYATLYLSPRDYHRVHMPLGGRLRETVHIPGRLFSVSPLTTRVIPRLFARNERLAAIFDTAAGPMALVLVGAINVSSIETVWAGVITPPYATRISRRTYPQTDPDAVRLSKGAEMGRFNMGSTVIVLFGKNKVRWDPAIHADAAVQIGQRMGTFTA